jgi:cyanophycinase
VREIRGTLALIGGGEWVGAGPSLLAELARRAWAPDGPAAETGAREVTLLPTAAAFEHPDRVIARARAVLEPLGVGVRAVPVIHRAEASAPAHVEAVRRARFLHVADGSPLHLRSVLKGSPLLEAMLDAYRQGALVAASGAGASVLCDPMVDPRGGAYTVGLGFVEGLAAFPYHGTAADHLRARSLDLLPAGAHLVGIDEATALVREPHGRWTALGAGRVTVYGADDTGAVVELGSFGADSEISILKM